MKPVKIIISILAILLVVSCETRYRMVTTLERNGKVHREVYAFEKGLGFSARDTSKNQFLFHLSPDWKVTCSDTVIKYNFFGDESEYKIKISKDANSIEQYSLEIQYDEDMQPYAAPEESLVKKFRWFYTHYSFKTVYKKLKYDAPVSIDDYLTKKEQILWTQGNMSDLKVMNGTEMNDYLDKINDDFLEWCSRNFFEISFESIKKLTTKYDLDTAKEHIYKKIRKEKIEAFDIEPETVCTFLDSFYVTIYFSNLYKTNKETIDKDFQRLTSISIFDMGNTISYELVIQGKLIKTNAPIVASDTLIWKVNGMRLLFEDYTLTAEYRMANIWAFIFAGLIIIIAIGSFILLRIRNR